MELTSESISRKAEALDQVGDKSKPGFDFQRFLTQMRHRSADPVARYLRSFLIEFAKQKLPVSDQVRVFKDFMTFILEKMAVCEVWHDEFQRDQNDAREGMEKLVMSRLYPYVFSPAIAADVNASPGQLPILTQDVVGQSPLTEEHSDDLARDDILSQKLRIYYWIQESHLDIEPMTKKSQRLLVMAQKELLKIKLYRAPRDKTICILNCCKIVIGILKSISAPDTSADSLLPLLILVVIKARPDHLVSNLHYVMRFRHSIAIEGEASYYLSSLISVVTFVENLDQRSLSISPVEFERKIESAILRISSNKT